MTSSLKSFLFFISSSLFLNSCSDSPKDQYAADMDRINLNLDTIIDGKISKNILKSIPSPVEINTYILASEAKYQKQFLSEVDSVSKYVTVYKKSLNLGVYSADMAYINLHRKYRDVFSYFQAVRTLTSDLNIATLFDLAKLKYYSENMHDNDSLVYVLSKDFDFMINHLNENNKSDVAVLMIVGGFIESLNIAVQVYEQTGNRLLKEKILKQKYVINDLVKVIEPFNQNEVFNRLLAEIKDLNTRFNEVYATQDASQNLPSEAIDTLPEIFVKNSDLHFISIQIKKTRAFIIKP